MISENTLAKVRDLPIQRILEPYVKFKREGGHTLKGLCPFHSERTPSFAVNLSKNLYHCFGCNRGGDGITFIMEKENLNFLDAVRFIAKQHNITIEYTKDGETTEEEKTEQKRKESLLVALDILQNFFVNNLRLAGSDETRHAQDYAYGRWPEEFCSEAGIGYAPKDGKAFMDFCRQKGIQEDLLFELGMFKRAEDNDVYPMFRERIMIPVRNRWGRIIAYTARYIGTNPKAPKYINSATSLIYTKGETLFGIDRAFRLRNPENIIIVEGAPDVLRMQSIGLENTVASLGTAWNENQLELLKRHTDSLCFIPDSDVSEDGLPGAGFKAAMENGALAIRKGFHVTVRELPLGSRELTEEESQKMYEGQAIPPEALREIPMKNDADSYIQDEATYRNLREKHFIVWNAEKLFQAADSLAGQQKVVAQTADLLRYVKDQMVYDQCIEQLGQVYGKARLWKDAVTQARNQARRNSRQSTMDKQLEEADALRQLGLFVRNNCYYALGDNEEDPTRISNFILTPLFHIYDENNGIRLFRLTNSYRQSGIIELKESELCSLTNFQQKVGSLGNYVWLGKIDKLNRVKEFLYARTDTAERIRKLGWNDSEQFFAFGNGIYQHQVFHEVDEMGIIRGDNRKAY